MDNLGLNVTNTVALYNPGGDYIVRMFDQNGEAEFRLAYSQSMAETFAANAARAGKTAVVFVAKAVYAPPSPTPEYNLYV